MAVRLIPVLFALSVVGVTSQDLFRNQLFPDQQQINLIQHDLQNQLQALHRRWQVAQGVDLQTSLQLQQSELMRRLQETQLQQQQLQARLQEELFAGLRFPGIQSQQSEVRQQFQPVQEPVQQFQPVQEPVQPFQPVQEPVQPFQQPQQEPVQELEFAVQEPVPTAPPQQTTPPPPVARQAPVFELVFQDDNGPPDVFVQEVVEAPPCATTEGQAGFCKPLVKCITFYTELPELRRHPCRLQGNEFGVCCPSKKRPAVPPVGQGSNGVLHAPPPPRIVIPPITPAQLNSAAAVALERIKQRVEFLQQLFANNVIIQNGTPASQHQEFFASTNTTLQQGEEGLKNVEASVSLVNQFNLTPAQGAFALPTFSILNTVIADTCTRSTSCRAHKYRSADGSCNNLANDRWGRVNVALQRVLPPNYGDGVNAPRALTADGQNLTSARVISTQFHLESDQPDENYTLLLMQWGQFLDHDLTHTPISRGQSGIGLSCCRDGRLIEESLRHPDCFPISLPLNDHIFAPYGERCMEFVRSLPAPRPECNFGPREQMNQVTGYIDGSNIYGSTVDTQDQLRERSGGRLRIQNVRGRSMLPGNRGECQDRTQTLTCFKAGDSRANEQVELAVMHTIWMREHNRVADQMAALHPQWSDEAVYQEARRIVVAEMQHVTYNEFLPLVLGRAYMDKFSLTPRESGFSTLYDAQLNAGITNVFATAAFRFGHSLIQGNIKGYSRFGTERENLVMHKHHFSPFVLYKDGAFDDFIRGLSTQTCQKFDRFFSKELTDHLFQGDLEFGLDLIALNIQRGRDHGLPPYNEWRQVCGMPRVTSWEGLLDVMDNPSVATLKRLYTSVDEVDLFVAAVAERPIPGALVGPTFVCLIGDQFARLRRGDRFFYEEANQPSSFTESQLNELRKASLARVLCDNSDDIAVMQPLSFLQASYANQRVPCASESVPRVNLKAWAREVPQA